MAWPLARASTWAAVNSCASRMASWRKARAPLLPKAETLARAVAMPMMTRTTIISSKVKPCWVREGAVSPGARPRPVRRQAVPDRGPARPERPMWPCRPTFRTKLDGPSASPGTDIGIDAFASGLPVGAQRKHVDFAVHPGVEILIGGVPGVVGHAVHVGCALAFTADKHTQ